MHAGRCAARATVRIAAAFLPRPESRIMAEMWAADLDHADELNVDCGDIARGAVAFVVRRGPSAWWPGPLRMVSKAMGEEAVA